MSMPSQIKQLNEVSLADQAYEMMRNAILEGELKPEERFTIEKMASKLGISRTPVREALKALENDGFVRLLPHRGAIVETYALDEIGHRYLLAALMEGYAAEQACVNRTSELISKLERNCERLSHLCQKDPFTNTDIRKAIELNQEFHNLLREAAGSRTLIRIMSTLRQPTSYSIKHWTCKNARTSSAEIHRKIFEAVRDGDEEASRILAQSHLEEAFEQVKKRLWDSSENGE